MTVPELFHHENLFVGSLAVRRIRRHKVGETLGAANLQHSISIEEGAQLARLAERQLYQLSLDHNQPDYDLSIMTQAMDYESINKCPALTSDYHCSIQNDRKPIVCSMVPFDSLYPDSLQNIVLMNRGYRENCISNQQRDDLNIVINNRKLVDWQYQAALKQRRDDLAMEKQLWGAGVFAQLQNEFFYHPAITNKIPIDNGILCLSIIPVLTIVAGISENCRLRCLQYIDSQLKLIDSKINQAISRKSAQDKPITLEFRGFKEKYLKFRSILSAHKPDDNHFKADFYSESQVSTLETYLGISP
ncbi:hypothetical protein [Methylomonas sp. AM2-LC]|uniref:hypothetical protein n=1 Tax=Methylomonas sp. AM2-LC TaxID=3153301 RepID=UPI003263E417